MSPAASATPATVTAQDAIVQILNRYKPVVGKLLARTDIGEETFVAQIANAMRATPKLWECEPATVLGAALRCAQLAMPPNDGNNLCWIIPYGKNAAFQLGYGGALELARRAEPGIRFEGRAVFPNDLFDLDYGTGRFKHVPWFSRRGKASTESGGNPRLWYVRVTHPDGGQHVHVLDRAQVEYHRSFSRQPDGDMWKKSYDAAALKSVVLDMKRWLPLTPQLAVAQAADGTVIDVRDLDPDQPELPAPDPDDAADAEWVAEAKGES